MATPIRYRTYYKRVVCNDGDGRQWETELKAWVYPTQAAAWEARRIIAALGYHGRFEDEPKVFFKAIDALADKVKFADCFDLSSEVVPSRKALEARGELDARFFCESREEWQISTAGVVRMLLVMDRCRRGAGKLRARSFFRGLAAAVCGCLPEELAEPSLLDGEVEACGIPVQAPNMCPHFEAALQQCPDGISEVDKGILLLMQGFRQAACCKGCSGWCCRAGDSLATRIDTSLPTIVCETDPLNMSLHIQGRSGKKRRYDEDYKEAVSRDVLVKKRAISLTSHAATTDKLATKTAASWDHDSLAWYQSAAWQSFGKANDVSITMDASRLGNPGLDCMMYAMASVDLGRSCWLPPQDRCGATHLLQRPSRESDRSDTFGTPFRAEHYGHNAGYPHSDLPTAASGEE